MYCSNCGRDAEGNFCFNCGAPLRMTEAEFRKQERAHQLALRERKRSANAFFLAEYCTYEAQDHVYPSPILVSDGDGGFVTIPGAAGYLKEAAEKAELLYDTIARVSETVMSTGPKGSVIVDTPTMIVSVTYKSDANQTPQRRKGRPRKPDAVIPTVPPEEVPAEGGAQG